jgi:hypothetical protein
MTASLAYNNIVKELESDFGEGIEFDKYKTLLLNMPPQAYEIVWEEYKDKANMFSLCFIVEAMAALFQTTSKEH